MKIESFGLRSSFGYQVAIERLDRVIKAIGLKELEKFNQWAFRKHPMTYDDNLTFTWENVHSTKGVSGDPDQVLRIILDLWDKREMEWTNEYFGD